LYLEKGSGHHNEAGYLLLVACNEYQNDINSVKALLTRLVIDGVLHSRYIERIETTMPNANKYPVSFKTLQRKLK
jgi:hypothetical protein